ncbi:MAG: sigma-70 family RNA polymerase sigma factor [Rhizobiales bacterium]|nr:sigma-70 family RNA polymerase sigma factor [Hyphomicrobiales bacterium]
MKSGTRPEVDGDDCLLVTLIPALRAFARTFYRDPDSADDLVQETLTKAISNIAKYESGTRMKSWLFTIMRNTFYNRMHLASREAPSAIDDMSARLKVEPSQEWACRSREIRNAIERLPPQQREILILVGMLGVSYEEASKICDCAMGTVKSRLNRARASILEELGEASVTSLLEQRLVLSGEQFVQLR